jgi:hypothetical protein
VFVPATAFPMLGAATMYDTSCQQAADAAGLTGHYMAWISDSNSLAKDRLRGRGFIRMDGQPFADLPSDLTTTFRIFNAVRFDEYGREIATDVKTGTHADGSLGRTCNNWAGGDAATYGTTVAGPGGFTNQYDIVCPDATGTIRTYCFQTDWVTSAEPPAPTAGARTVWLSAPTFDASTGIAGANALCAAAMPAGVTTAHALVQTTGPATLPVNSSDILMRPDGVVVGTGSQFLAGTGLLESGIWQNAAGAYQPGGTYDTVFTGSDTPGALGTPATTCMNWSTQTGTARIGMFGSTDTSYWHAWWGDGGCGSLIRVYCISN